MQCTQMKTDFYLSSNRPEYDWTQNIPQTRFFPNRKEHESLSLTMKQMEFVRIVNAIYILSIGKETSSFPTERNFE